MGTIQSIPQEREPDPWWPNQVQQQEQCNQQTVAIPDAAPEVRDQEHESWLKIQELSKTVQLLADQRVSLTNANRENEEQQKEELNNLRTQYLQQELALKKLEDDAMQHKKLITYLKDKLEITESERDRAVDKNKELNSIIKELQHGHANSEEENKRLQEQLLTERKEQEQLLQENRRLTMLLETKQTELLDRAEGTEENSNDNPQEADTSCNSKRTPTPSSKATAELEKFREEMKTKREARHQALQAISNEMERLRGELNAERAAKCEAIQELERMKEEGVQDHIRIQLEDRIVQLNKKTEECEQLKSDKEKYETQIAALKEVITITKQMLGVRENQVDQLKKSIQEIEGAVMGGKHNGPITDELRSEYESQMENIKSLKALYTQRMKLIEDEKEKLLKEQERLTAELQSQTKKSTECEEQIKELDAMISERNQTVSDLQDQLSDSLDQSRNLSNELALINNIFTQMLVGSDADLDKLIKVLQENHDLMTNITTSEDCEETAASLPRLLLNLIHQVNTSSKDDSGAEASGSLVSSEEDVPTSSDLCKTEEHVPTTSDLCKTEENGLNLDAHEIASKLPKVWKVLLELISQQVVPTATQESKDSCYKTIDTPIGPRLVISVSKTFIRLKDLILEKKSLQKELVNLKQLNGHLESKLIQQEKRLSLVSTELRKTWSVVGRMHTQYQQLHTHEKVLRYELQQKRKMLNELKEELEYCREKWVEARKKNSQSEAEWRKLRKEFSSRKKEVEDTFNNSGESGYSDDRGDDSGDDTSQSASPILDTPVKESELDRLEVDVAVNSHEILSETETTEESSISSQNSSLPDLVSVATENNTSQLPQELLQNQTEEQALDECPTISLVISLKQQLACFSRDLEKITSSLDLPEHQKAIQSIFSLPAIQVPEHLLQPKVGHAKSKYKSLEKVCDAHAEQPQQLSEKVRSQPPKSLEPSDRQEELHEQAVPQPPSLPPPPVPTRSPEEILQARAARLKRLEEQCQQLFNKVTRTTERSTTLSNQLDELHQHYGPHDTASSSRSSQRSISSSSSRPEDNTSRMTLQSSSSINRPNSSSSTPTEHEDASSLSSDIPLPPPLPQRLPAVRLPSSLDHPSEDSSELHESENT